MPLSPPAPRKLEHLRDIALRGYEREDGMADIEAHLTDTKTHGFPSDYRGQIEPGEPLHGMWVRMTVDADMVIVACEASSDHTPYETCINAAPNFSRLAGLKIGPGFNRAVNERVGGVEGCTHIRELMAQMATVAFQTMFSIKARRARAAREARGGEVEAPRDPAKRPALLGTCIAYAPESPVVARRWPEWAAKGG
jgi:hypothetical protein